MFFIIKSNGLDKSVTIVSNLSPSREKLELGFDNSKIWTGCIMAFKTKTDQRTDINLK